jgi:hypothetical protein
MHYAYSNVIQYQAYKFRKHKKMKFSFQMIMIKHTLDSPLPPPKTNIKKDHWTTTHTLLVWMDPFSLTTCMVGMTISSSFLCLFAAEIRHIKYVINMTCKIMLPNFNSSNKKKSKNVFVNPLIQRQKIQN